MAIDKIPGTTRPWTEKEDAFLIIPLTKEGEFSMPCGNQNGDKGSPPIAGQEDVRKEFQRGDGAEQPPSRVLAPEAVRLERLDDSLDKLRELKKLWGHFDFSQVRLPDVSAWEDDPE